MNQEKILNEEELKNLRDSFNDTFYKQCRKNIFNIKNIDGKMMLMDTSHTHITDAFTFCEKYKPIKEITDLTLYKTITSSHIFCYYGFFKPDLKEVYSQIRNSLTEEEFFKIKAFEMVSVDELGSNFLFANINSHNIHTAKINIYI